MFSTCSGWLLLWLVQCQVQSGRWVWGSFWKESSNLRFLTQPATRGPFSWKLLLEQAKNCLGMQTSGENTWSFGIIMVSSFPFWVPNLGFSVGGSQHIRNAKSLLLYRCSRACESWFNRAPAISSVLLLLPFSFIGLKLTKGLFWNNCSGRGEGILWKPSIKIMPGRDQGHWCSWQIGSAKK